MALTLENIKGRAIDLDSHEMVPIPRWGDVFGKAALRYLELNPEIPKIFEERAGKFDGWYGKDNGETEITEKSVWEAKGTLAPSSVDIGRRPEVLDMMGIRRALIFPAFGAFAFAAASGGGQNRFSNTDEDQQEAGWAGVDAYNEWAAAVTSMNPDRMRLVGILPTIKPGMTLDALMAETKRQMKMGIRAFYFSTALPPVGLSPARKELDPWYALMAEANIPIALHAGTGIGYRRSDDWARAPQFMNWFSEDAQMVGDPLSFSSFSQAEENFISALVLGGVFERHPTLRLCAIELGGYWIGPLAERLDILADPALKVNWAGAKELKLKPSEYIARHVRVTPFVYEPVVRHFERYPHLQDCYCFSTDYPHTEGNTWSMKKFYDQLSPKVSDDILDKFFVTNGLFVVP